MSPAAGVILINEILPRLRATIPRLVRPVGAEDHEELVQDAAAIASGMLHSAEARGITIMPASIAYFAVQSLKSGRRSTQTGRVDAMCPAAQLDGRATMISMDAPMDGVDGDTENQSLHDPR